MSKEDEWAEGDYLDWLEDSEDEEEEKQKRMNERNQEAKRIKWKIIDRDYEYEVIVGEKKLGSVVRSNGKWVVQPEFIWNEDSFSHRDLAKSSYEDFRESGQALVDLWCLS